MQTSSSFFSTIKRIAEFFLPDSRQQALLVYGELHKQARATWFYEQANVPDTIDGRFELLVLHVFLWINRMKQEDNYEQAYQPITKQLLEVLFDDLDSALREMGVGDTGVPRRIKAMAEALYGRMDAYETALESKEAVYKALRRNIYAEHGNDSDINLLQLYLGYIADHLAQRPAERLSEGTLMMPEPAELMAE